MTLELDPYTDVPPPTDDDYADDDDGQYGTSVALRGELVEVRERDAIDNTAVMPDGYRATDAGNARRMIAAANGRLRYVHLWKKWIVYSGGRWVLDAGDALVTEQAKEVARGLFRSALEADMDKRPMLFRLAHECESTRAITAMVKLARAIPGVIIAHDELDARPWLLNVENGTVDLRTGYLRPHDPADLLTKQAPVSYDPNATAPLWESCLQTWHPDETVRAFLQRAVGSGATGHPVEVLVVNTGGGRNGKSKFYGAITKVLGEYVVIPHKSLLVQTRHEPHPTVIASLYGARMLVASETDDGDRLSEAQIKNLTGTDKLNARRMREDEWQFWPTHTAFMHTNHQPRIRGTDDGIWRRIRIVPWTVRIAAEDADEHLLAHLAREASGILNWIVSGARAWAADGLDEPEAVTAATDAYRAQEDHVGRFLADCCALDGRFSTPAAELREAYEKWCSETGEEAWSAKRLGTALTNHGLDSARVGIRNTRVWIGLDLNRETPGSDTCRPHPTSSSHSPPREGSKGGIGTKRSDAVGRNGEAPTDEPSTDESEAPWDGAF